MHAFFQFKIASLFFVCLLFSQNTWAFCVQSFNGYGPAYAPRVESRTVSFTREIVHKGCEVVNLQEIWNSNQIQTLKALARNSYSIFAPNQNIKFGLMSLSKFQNTAKPESYVFEHNDDGGLLDGGREVLGVKKGWTHQRIRVPELDSDFDFVNLHLHPQSEAVRFAQLLEVLSWRVKQADRRPLIISGDFNMSPLSAEYFFTTTALKLKDPVLEKWGRYPHQFCTYCSSNPLSWLNEDKVFDYVFYSHNSPVQSVDVSLDLTGTPSDPYSDHFGLRVDFKPEPTRDRRHIESERYFLLSTLVRIEEPVQEKYGSRSRIMRGLRILQNQLNQRKGEFWDYLASREP